MAESVDATDLKSVDFLNREGSSPSIPNQKEKRAGQCECPGDGMVDMIDSKSIAFSMRGGSNPLQGKNWSMRIPRTLDTR